VDISSSLHFVAIVSAFIRTRFYDYRPAMLGLDNLSCDHADLLALPFADGSIPSLSCMHVVEHVGLGRYGDPLDPDGDLKAIAELKRVLAPGGDLLFVVPVGKPRILFNAHRIYSFEQVMKSLAPLVLAEFALVPDDPAAGLVRNAPPELVAEQRYGCGCFWFRKEIS
jgi:SAM-dependent methyltransferase